MRFTWRDGAGTILAALVVLALLAATQSWSWPMLGDFRSGVIVLAVLGLLGCSVGLRFTEASEFQRPVMIVGSLLGVTALALIVLGLVFATEALFVALAIVLLALWLLTTADHVLTSEPPDRLPTGT